MKIPSAGELEDIWRGRGDSGEKEHGRVSDYIDVSETTA